MPRWFAATVIWAPRLALVGAFSAVLSGASAAPQPEAKALLALLGGAVGVVVGAGVGWWGTTALERDGRALEAGVRVGALALILWCLSRSLVAVDRGSAVPLVRSVGLLGMAWVVLAEAAAPAWRNCRRPRRERPGATEEPRPACWSGAALLTLAAAALMLASGWEPAGQSAGSKLQVAETECAATVASSRVALIGLDGASWELLDLASRMGATPFMDRMRREGVWGPLYAEDPFSPPSWTTIATGLPASVHGVDDFQQREYADGVRLPMAPSSLLFLLDRILQRGESSLQSDAPGVAGALGRAARTLSARIVRPGLGRIEPRLTESYDLVATDAQGVRAPRLWNIAANAGLRCCIVRWLFSLPAEGLATRVLSGWREGWRTPVGANDGELLEMARILAKETRRERGDVDSIERYLETADEEVQTGVRLALEIVSTDPKPNFYSHIFYFPDGLGHRLAVELRRAVQEPDAASPRVKSLVDDLARIDQLLADLARRDYALVVVSDHGMEPLPRGTKIPIVSQIYQLQWMQLLEDLGLGSRESPWFSADNSSTVILRQLPSAPADALDAAIERLRSLRLADNRPLFGRVDRRGENSLELGQVVTISDPGDLDLAVIGLNSPHSLGRYVHDRGIRGLHGRPLPKLDHVLGRYGIVMVRADGTKSGKVSGLTTRDIAPVVLYLLGLPLEPKQRSEGLEIAFSADYLDERPLRRRHYPTPLPMLASQSARESDSHSMEALRALGYIN